jgi:hypothetical protein
MVKGKRRRMVKRKRKPYVFQIKLRQAERMVVRAAARAASLPASTWARKILLGYIAQTPSWPRSKVAS